MTEPRAPARRQPDRSLLRRLHRDAARVETGDCVAHCRRDGHRRARRGGRAGVRPHWSTDVMSRRRLSTCAASPRSPMRSRQMTTCRCPIVVVLDLGLPDGDGLDLCRIHPRTLQRLRRRCVTGRDEEVDKLRRLPPRRRRLHHEAVLRRELVARVEALLRRPRMDRAAAVVAHVRRTRAEPAPPARSPSAGVRVGPHSHRVRPARDDVGRTRRSVFTRQQLLERCGARLVRRRPRRRRAHRQPAQEDRPSDAEELGAHRARRRLLEHS